MYKPEEEKMPYTVINYFAGIVFSAVSGLLVSSGTGKVSLGFATTLGLMAIGMFVRSLQAKFEKKEDQG